MDLENDKSEISSWFERFQGTKEIENIKKFILENGLILNIDELILTNYEIYPIGDNEVKLAISVKNQINQIVAFLILDEFDLNKAEPELFLQYIVVRPDYQHKGYGKQILSDLPGVIENITGKKPVFTTCYIHKENSASLALFEKFGFCFKDMHDPHGLMQSIGFLSNNKTKE